MDSRSKSRREVTEIEQFAGPTGPTTRVSIEILEGDQLPRLVFTVGQEDAQIVEEFFMAGFGYGNGFSVVVQHEAAPPGPPASSEADELENAEGDSTYENSEGTDTVESGS